MYEETGFVGQFEGIKMYNVLNRETLEKAGGPEHGCVYWIADEERMYLCNEGELMLIDGGQQEFSLYDYNKQLVNQLDPMTMNEITLKLGLIQDYYNEHMNNYHMLLCKDYNYYTIFACDTMLSFPDFSSAVCTTITELGSVYSIEQASDNTALEIWIKPNGEEMPLAFYLFPYDAGVIYYG